MSQHPRLSTGDFGYVYTVVAACLNKDFRALPTYSYLHACSKCGNNLGKDTPGYPCVAGLKTQVLGVLEIGCWRQPWSIFTDLGLERAGRIRWAEYTWKPPSCWRRVLLGYKHALFALAVSMKCTVAMHILVPSSKGIKRWCMLPASWFPLSCRVVTITWLQENRESEQDANVCREKISERTLATDG